MDWLRNCEIMAADFFSPRHGQTGDAAAHKLMPLMTLTEMFTLTGKVAVITGGARHLGFDMADVLAEAGCDLVITSRQLAHAEAAAETLRAGRGREVLPLALDVSDPARVRTGAQQALEWKGHVDILISNSGGSPGPGPNLFERKPEEIRELISVNLLGTLYCAQEFGRIMVRQGGGKIINIASIAAVLGRDRRMYERLDMRGQPVDYTAAKAGIVGLTRDLAAVLSPQGVHVNCISPGGFARAGMSPAFINAYSDRTPMGRMGREGSPDLRGAALFLASPASDYVTGHNLVVDGGFTIWQ
jgi:NAD(P)-dependent dehydrogenase (short-subunit alcohol dehydrogenase family)